MIEKMIESVLSGGRYLARVIDVLELISRQISRMSRQIETNYRRHK